VINFERVTAQHLRSDTGFEILPAGRFQVIYRENGRDMDVQIEFGQREDGAACINLWPGAFARWDDNSPVLSLDQQLHIEKNFRAAMKFDGFELLVWDPRTNEYLETAAYHGRLTAAWD
jgi:hypothetical protein